MYALSLGIQTIGQSLPLPVYPLLSGLNAAVVGIIALAAVQLADKAIRDKLTRIQVLFGACALRFFFSPSSPTARFGFTAETEVEAVTVTVTVD